MTCRVLLLLLVVAGSVSVSAQAPPEAPDAVGQAELAEARVRLEEAAREVARLSAQIVGPEVDQLIHRLRAGGRRAMLGVSIEAAEDGVLVAGVTPGGPAAEAGVASGDLIKSINGVDVSSEDGVRRLVDEMRNVEAGDDVPLSLERDGQPQTIEVTAAEFSARRYVFAYGDEDQPGALMEGDHDFDVRIAPPGWQRLFRMGRWADMELVELTPALGDYFGTDQGLLVVRAPADAALQLEDGDVILKIGQREPRDTGHAMRILRSFEEGETLALEIMRKKRKRTLAIQITGDEKVSQHRP